MDQRLNMSQHCELTAQKVKCTLDCNKKSVASSACPSRDSPLEYGVQPWGPQHKQDRDVLKQVQSRAMKIIRELEHSSYEGSLRELGLVSLDKRRLWGDPTAPPSTQGGPTRWMGRNSLSVCVVIA